MSGKLIVIEGLDGSGKATQTKLLYDALAAQNVSVRQVSFPNYDSDACAPVKMYLHGDFGQKPTDVNAYAASVLYTVDRFASYKTDWGAFYESGGVVLADRYTTSNGIHQCSKLPKEEWAGYLQWLFDFEYDKICLPRPNMVLYLHVDPQVSQELMKKRYAGDESKKDIHERDVAYLQRAQEAAFYCAKTLGWQTIDCAENGAMRTVEDIHAQIMKFVQAL